MLVSRPSIEYPSASMRGKCYKVFVFSFSWKKIPPRANARDLRIGARSLTIWVIISETTIFELKAKLQKPIFLPLLSQLFI